ncbi:MAG: hypothetical protein K2H22_04300 [Muribaculaceae bacterium]|nr:hypothetical protein [Muribaculaceae bacterium]
MKGFFTCLPKGSVLPLLLSCLISGVFSASAEEYRSMIRYDRVWEYLETYWDTWSVYYVKFDGAEEINGKTYHRLVAFRKAKGVDDNDHQSHLTDIDENFYRHEGYLREEDGKVYTLISNAVYSDGFFLGGLYMPTDNGEHPTDLEERLIYDFTCNEGESYRGLQLEYNWAEDMTWNVTSVDSVEIDGEEHRRMRVYAEGYEDQALTMVEGIGIDSYYGCLTDINFLHILTYPFKTHIFSRVLGMDGKVLYCGEDGSLDIPVGDFLGVGTLMQPSEAEAPIYDVMGRRISSPAPGQLYIQGGKKHIAR